MRKPNQSFPQKHSAEKELSSYMEDLENGNISVESGKGIPSYYPKCEACMGAIESLWNDPETRAKFNAAGRKKMQEEFGLRKNEEHLTAVTKRFS